MSWNFSFGCLAVGVKVQRVYNWDDVSEGITPRQSAWYVESFFPFVHGVWIIDAGHKRPAETSAEGTEKAN